jgi:SRSO17 transposase
MVAMADDGWREELDGWLEPFLVAVGHVKRRRWAPVYLEGLIGPGERKSVQPMAAQLGLSGHDQLHHFVTSPTWDDAPLRQLLVEKADALVGGPDAVLVIDDTALPKQGRLSVGVARQYCGCLGKRANCQVPSAGPSACRPAGRMIGAADHGLAHPGPERGAGADRA